MTLSNPSCTTLTRELSKRARRSSVTLGVLILQAKVGERWPDVIAPPQGWDEKDERWKRAQPILAHPHVLRCRGATLGSAKCVTKVHLVGAAKSKLARKECIGHPATAGTARMTTMSPPGTDWQLCVVLQVWCESSQVRKETWRTVCWASEISRVRTKHPFAVGWLASQRESISWITKTVHEASMGEVAAKLHRAGSSELKQAVIRLRTADAQPTNPDDKKHLLLKTVEIKWCWKCGARVERDSAPRLLLKTACSGAPRTKEYERALSLLGKGATSEELCVCGASVTHL